MTPKDKSSGVSEVLEQLSYMMRIPAMIPNNVHVLR